MSNASAPEEGALFKVAGATLEFIRAMSYELNNKDGSQPISNVQLSVYERGSLPHVFIPVDNDAVVKVWSECSKLSRSGNELKGKDIKIKISAYLRGETSNPFFTRDYDLKPHMFDWSDLPEASVLLTEKKRFGDQEERKLMTSASSDKSIFARIGDVFESELRQKVKAKVEAWLLEREALISYCGVMPVPTFAAITKYLDVYYQLIRYLMSSFSDTGADDLSDRMSEPKTLEDYNCFRDCSIVDIILNADRCFDGDLCAPYLISPSLLHSLHLVLLRINDIAGISDNKAGEPGNTQTGADWTDKSLDPFDIAIMRDSLLTSFCSQSYHAGRMFFLSTNDGTNDFNANCFTSSIKSVNEIPTIRLFEKIRYTFKRHSENKRSVMKVAIIGNVRKAPLEDLMALLDLELNEEKNDNTRIIITVYSDKEICSKELFSPLSFVKARGEYIHLPFTSHISRIFEKDGNKPKHDAIFFLDNGFLYSPAPFPDLISPSRYLNEHIPDEHYAYGPDAGSKRQKNPWNSPARTDFCKALRYLARLSAKSFERDDIFRKSFNATLYKRISRLLSENESSDQVVYLYYSNTKIFANYQVEAYNIARREIYDGKEATILRLTSKNNFDNKLVNNQKSGDERLKNAVVCMSLWQIIKSCHSNIFNDIYKQIEESRKSDYIIFEPKYRTEPDIREFITNLISIFSKAYIALDYGGLLDPSSNSGIKFVVSINTDVIRKKIANEGDAKDCANVLKNLAISIMETSDDTGKPLHECYHNALKKALYGRARTVEDIAISCLYSYKPERLLGNGRAVAPEGSVCESRERDPSAENLKKLEFYKRCVDFNKEASDHIKDKRYYADIMKKADFKKWDRIQQLSDLGILRANYSEMDRYEIEEEYLRVLKNIATAAETINYTDSQLYNNVKN